MTGFKSFSRSRRREAASAVPGFKVVKDLGDGVLRSITAPMESELVYAVGVVTTPRDRSGPMCVFAEAVRALQFVSANEGLPQITGEPLEVHHFRIFHCQYRPSRHQSVWGPSAKQPGRTIRMSLDSLPDGAALADEVTLTEEVKPR